VEREGGIKSKTDFVKVLFNDEKAELSEDRLESDEGEEKPVEVVGEVFGVEAVEFRPDFGVDVVVVVVLLVDESRRN